MIILKSDQEIQCMREAGRVVAQVLDALTKAVAPGISTAELDRLAERIIRDAGALPSFKGYNGFPASICASVNEEVVHGIPGMKVLRSGDIISIDVGAQVNGFHGDAAVTLPVGVVDPETARLLQVTEESLYKGIAQAKEGQRLSDISHAVQTHAEAHGYGVVRDYVGHGIGRAMHEDPQIPNFGPPGRGPRLKAGMVLAIEPMVNAGTFAVESMPDGWTVVTSDRRPSAHFEHTVAITTDGPVILTRL
ncbi:MAG: type I methionyl aminopeptidase [Bacillota bacterium]